MAIYLQLRNGRTSQGWKKKIVERKLYAISSRHQSKDLDELRMEESVKGPRAFLTVINCRPLVPCRFLAVRLGTRSGAKVGL